MPKPSTLPTLLDSALQLNIGKLKKEGFILTGIMRAGTISWSRNDRQIASICIMVNMQAYRPYIELDYNYNDQPRNYRIEIVGAPSNIGDGIIWYFLCPETGKRCRILYSVGGWFRHREAFRNVCYDSQTQSKKTRNYMRVVGPLFKTDKLYDELHRPYFKRYYAGLPTKRYTHILKKLKQAEQVSVEDYERVMAGIF